jgi:hypothetical protein
LMLSKMKLMENVNLNLKNMVGKQE